MNTKQQTFKHNERADTMYQHLKKYAIVTLLGALGYFILRHFASHDWTIVTILSAPCAAIAYCIMLISWKPSRKEKKALTCFCIGTVILMSMAAGITGLYPPEHQISGSGITAGVGLFLKFLIVQLIGIASGIFPVAERD